MTKVKNSKAESKLNENGHSFVKNTASFHPEYEGGGWKEPEEWKNYEDTQLRNMLVRLGIKSPENYRTRLDMILELEKITKVNDKD